MRVARGSGRVISDRLYSAARQSAEAITATGSVAIGLPRYLVLLGDALQSLPPTPVARPIAGSPSPAGAAPRRSAPAKNLAEPEAAADVAQALTAPDGAWRSLLD